MRVCTPLSTQQLKQAGNFQARFNVILKKNKKSTLILRCPLGLNPSFHFGLQQGYPTRTYHQGMLPPLISVSVDRDNIQVVCSYILQPLLDYYRCADNSLER